MVLHYPDRSAILVAGLPGAGKSTLLARAADPAGAVVLDTDPLRKRWQERLGALPYPLWRPLLHMAHHARIWRALGEPGPVVVGEPGTRPLLRKAFIRRARRGGHTVHLVAIDATPREARDGQKARGRKIARSSLARHARRWGRAKATLRHEGFDTVRLLARTDAARVASIAVGAHAPAPPAERRGEERRAA